MDYIGGFITKNPVLPTAYSASGVWKLAQATQYIKAGYWPFPPTSDPYFEYVTLLLPGNGTNGAQNNTFLDSSTNNFTITRNGNTTQGTFSPFSRSDGYWSNYFDGTGDYISSSKTQTVPATGDFTVDGWFYLNTNSYSNFPSIFSQGTSGTSGRFVIFINNDGKLAIQITTSLVTFGSAVTPFQWNYFAVTRSGSTITVYLNGSSIGTTTNSDSIQNTTPLIGSEWNGDPYRWQGYLSNIRVSNTIRSISLPTAPFTSDGNTTLLACQSNRFVDTSGTPATLTPFGNTSVQPFSPFAPSAAYSASTNGGSGYFDENGDYLDCGNGGTDYEFGSGDFTIEGWFYCLGKSQRHQMIMAKGSPTTNNAYDWRLYWGDTSNQRIWFDSNVFSVSSDATTTEDLVLNAWNHIAVVRSGANGYLYLNGTRIDSVAASGTMNNSYTNVYVGAGNVGSAGQTYYNGYANGVRLLKGTAQYTGSTYTVPTSPFTAITNTELLLNFTNAGIYDAAAMNDLETVGNARISTAQSKFGGGSMYFDGTGDYLVAAASPTVTQNMTFGTGDFTIEMWIYLNSTPTGTFWIVYDPRPSGTQGAYPMIYLDGANATVKYWVNSADRITGGNLSTSTWYHLAICRSGTSTKLFIDGTQSGSTYTDSTNYLASRLYIAASAFAEGFYAIDGYLQDIRVTKGYARYTANFTPTNRPFPLY